MSGGHFGYIHNTISTYINELEYEIKNNAYMFDTETLDILKKINEYNKLLNKLNKNVDYLYSGDICEDDIKKCFKIYVDKI